MKKTLASLALLICFASASFAQDGLLNHLYMSFGYGFGGAPNANFSTKDFAIRSFDFSFGFRFNEHLSVFVPLALDDNLMNMTTTKNYNETGTLGLGASYTFNLGSRSFLEPVLSCNTTYIKSDLNYLTPKFEVRWGAKMGRFGPFVGLGVQYLHPYDNGTVPNMTMVYAKIGARLF
jgi:hypothetical protein